MTVGSLPRLVLSPERNPNTPGALGVGSLGRAQVPVGILDTAALRPARQVTRQRFLQAGGGDRPDARQFRREAAPTAYAARPVWTALAERCRRSRVGAWFPNGEAGSGWRMRRLGVCRPGSTAMSERGTPTTQPTSARSSPRTRPITPSPTVLPGRGPTRSCASGWTVRTSLARPSSPGTRSPLPPRSPSSRVRSPIPVRARATATCGSSASTPRVAAPSSPSGGCATLSPTSLLLSPQTSRRPAPQAPPWSPGWPCQTTVEAIGLSIRLIWTPPDDLGVCESGDVGGGELLVLEWGEPAERAVASLPVVDDL